MNENAPRDTVDSSSAAPASEREALLRAGIDDSIHTLCHLLKQTGKPDLDDIIRRVVTNVVPRLHAVLNGENPYD